MMDLSRLEKVKTLADIEAEVNKINAIQYLKDTDWYVTRQVETGKPIPEEVRTARQAAREQLS